MFWSLFIFSGHSTWEPASIVAMSRVTYFCVLTQEAELATANTRKARERFWKTVGEWTGMVEISKEETPGSKHSMYGYILTYSGM